MSVLDIPLRKALQLFYAPQALRRSILKVDIRLDRRKEAGGTRSRGGDFYLPFWSDVKKHISGDANLVQLTDERCRTHIHTGFPRRHAPVRIKRLRRHDGRRGQSAWCHCHVVGVGVCRAADTSRVHPSRKPLCWRYPTEIVLERLDAHAHRRLSDMQSISSSEEVAALHHLQKGARQYDIHVLREPETITSRLLILQRVKFDFVNRTEMQRSYSPLQKDQAAWITASK